MTLSTVKTRLESASGPDREIDAQIIVATQTREPVKDDLIYLSLPWPLEECEAGTYWRCSRSGRSLHTAPEFTDSVDAALGLVERKLPEWSTQIYGGGFIRNWTAVLRSPDAKYEDRPGHGGIETVRVSCRDACGIQKTTAPLAILTALLSALIAEEQT